MNETVCRSLCQLVGEFGPQLSSRPGICERLLHERAPAHPVEVQVLVEALRHGAAAPHLADQDPADLDARACRVARNAGLTIEQARWAVGTWKAALEGEAIPRSRAPFCPAADVVRAEPPEARNSAGDLRLALLGASYGTFAGLLAALVCLLAGEGAVLAHLAAKVPGHLLALALPCGLTGGAAVGALGGLVRLTRVPALLGGLAGAAVGAVGGWAFAPWVGALLVPGTQLSEAETVARMAASTCTGLAAGATLGIFQDLLFRAFYKWVARPPRDYSVLTGASAAKEIDRRRGL